MTIMYMYVCVLRCIHIHVYIIQCLLLFVGQFCLFFGGFFSMQRAQHLYRMWMVYTNMSIISNIQCHHFFFQIKHCTCTNTYMYLPRNIKVSIKTQSCVCKQVRSIKLFKLLTKGDEGEFEWLSAGHAGIASGSQQWVSSGAAIAHGEQVLHVWKMD